MAEIVLSPKLADRILKDSKSSSKCGTRYIKYIKKKYSFYKYRGLLHSLNTTYTRTRTSVAKAANDKINGRK
jgi:hypothetical protein